jgi:hypothetical protein
MMDPPRANQNEIDNYYKSIRSAIKHKYGNDHKQAC